MALTDLKIRAAKPAAKPYHLTNGHGLFLAAQPHGPKLWCWKYRFQGKFRLVAFGSYPIVGLADARAAHAAARAELHRGIDPMAERKAAAFRPADILKPHVTTNLVRVDASELPALLKKFDLYEGSHFVRLASELCSAIGVMSSPFFGRPSALINGSSVKANRNLIVQVQYSC